MTSGASGRKRVQKSRHRSTGVRDFLQRLEPIVFRRKACYPVVVMRTNFLSALSAIIIASTPAQALDCAKATGAVETLFCADPKLIQADKEMAAEYFKLLRKATDKEFHEALIRSQRRWLEVRSHGADRFGVAEFVDKTDDSEVLLKMTRDRLNFLRTAEPVHAMEEQRKILLNDGGGVFAGYETTCTLWPPPYGDWSYGCQAAIHRQHNDRICSSVTEWASGHTTEYRFVRALRGGVPRLLATCSTGYASTSEQCPDADNDAKTKTIAHWNTAPRLDDWASHADRLRQYDPDVEPSDINQPWFRECLLSPIYPPQDISRPSSEKMK